MENLKSDKPVVAIETVPECSPFYEDLRSRNHLLGETCGQSMYTENAVNESPKADPFKKDLPMNQLPFKPVTVYKPTISDEDCDVLISCAEFTCGGDEAQMYPVDKVEAYIRSLTHWNNTLPDRKPGPDYEGQDWVLVKAHEIDSGFELIPRVAEYNRMKGRWLFIDADDFASDNIFVTQWRIIE